MRPAVWDKAPIGELCQIVKGKTPIMKTKPGEYPLVTMGEEHRTANKYELDAEAVCVPMISSFGHGKPGLKRVHYIKGKFALSNILTALIVKEPTKLSTKFLALYIQTFKDQLIVPLQTGAANMSLRPDKLAGVLINFPPIREQDRIVKMIDESDAIHKIQDKSISRTDNYIPALFNKMFGDPNLNTNKWVKKPLTKLAQVIRGVSFSKGDASDTKSEKSVPILRAGNIGKKLHVDTESDLVWVDPKFVNDIQYLQPFDIVVAMSSGSIDVVGKAAGIWNAWHGSFGAFCGVIRSFDIDPLYLLGLMRTEWYLTWAKSVAQGANINNLRKSHLENLEILVPPVLLQQEFTRHIKEIHWVQQQQTVIKSKIDELHNSILFNFFGEVV